MSDMTTWVNYDEKDIDFDGFLFGSGQQIDRFKIRYFTMGTRRLGKDGNIANAVLLLHNTTGSGQYWLQPDVSDELFGPDQPLDLERYFIIAPDALGFGRSSKPSDGLRGHFPNYRFDDLVEITRKLLEDELEIKKLELIIGISMGGMLTWLLAGRYPDMAKAILPISCQPGPMSGRNWIQRRISIEAIRNDPDWQGGMYDENPTHFAFTAPISAMMLNSVTRLQDMAPTRAEADKFYWDAVERARKTDANDRLYQLEASMDYDPTDGLSAIEAKVITVSFADDQLNPVELGVVDRALEQVQGAKHVIIPAGPQTSGHFSARHAKLWAEHAGSLLSEKWPSVCGPLADDPA